MNTHALPKSTGFEKFIYSIGNIGANFCWAFVGGYITMYYTDAVGLAAATAGTILLLSRLLDGVSDIVCAWMFKKVHFKSGKIRPWFLVSAPLLFISMLLMFNVPASFSQSSKTIYAGVTYAFAQAVAYTIFCLAQSAIVTVVSYDPADRARFTAWGFAIINVSSVLINIMTPMILLAGGGANFQGGWTRISTIYAIATLILISLMGLFLKEKEPPEGYAEAESANDGEGVSWWTVVSFLLKDKNTWILVFIHVFGWLIQGIQGIEVFFYRDVLGDMQLYSLYGNIYVVAVVIGILCGPVLAKRFGRNTVNKTCIAISALGCLGYLAFASLETVGAFAVCLFMKGFGYGPLLGSAFVYSSDLSDYISERYHVVAAETASMTSSVGIKVGVGVGAGLVGWLLSAVGYVNGAAVQSAATQSGIRSIFALAPAIFNIGLFLCLCGWKLDKKQ